MIRKSILAVALSLAAFAAPAQNAYGIPENIQDGNILHCFDWTFEQITEELPAIAEAGFGAVQLSPLQGNCASGAEWYYAYLPAGFRVYSTGPGNAFQLKTLCAEAQKYGIKIIVDVVANHINGASSNREAIWNNTEYWHSPTYKGINYNSRSSITNDNLGDYPDLNSEHAVVREAVAKYIETLKSYGVKGIRWDAAKHIALPSECSQFWPDVTLDGLWHYGEILDGPGGNENALLQEYAKYMSITDSRYGNTLLNAIRSNSSTTVSGINSLKGVAPAKLVYWAESHDTYANNGGATKNVSQAVIDRAWALGACRQGATALYLSRPFKTGYQDIKMGVKGSTNFTEPHIAAVNHLRNAMGDTPEYLAQADGTTVITRGGGGACIVVGNGQAKTVSVPNGGSLLPAGTYTDQVAGGRFTVTASTISGPVGSTGIAVLYDESVLTAPRLSLEPGATSFTSETLSITATLINASTGWYSINGAARVNFSAPSATFSIGAGITEGQITVEWGAKEGSVERTGKAVYTKIDPNAAPADMPAAFYIVGEVNGNSWDPAQGVAMQRSGALFTATVSIDGYFSFAKRLGTAGNWGDFNTSGNRYGLPADGKISMTTPVTISQIDDPQAIALAAGTPAGSYTVTVDWRNMQVSLSDPSGVESVEADKAEPQYFTLQGMPAKAPLAPGFYIERRGTQVRKIRVR